MVKIPPKGRLEDAAINLYRSRFADHGVASGDFKKPFFDPHMISYAVICSDGTIVCWPSFDRAGNPAERLEIQTVQGIDPEIFIQAFAELYGKEYVRLPHRGGTGCRCFYLAPVPEDLLKPSARM